MHLFTDKGKYGTKDCTYDVLFLAKNHLEQ